MSTHWSDIIVALATPQGIGAIGVVRLSGNGCIALMDEIFPSKQLSNQPANTLHVGLISDLKIILMKLLFPCSNHPGHIQVRM